MAGCRLWTMHLQVCLLSLLNSNLSALAETPTVDLRLDSENVVEGNTLSLVCKVNSEGLESSVVFEWVRKTMNTTVTLARSGSSFDPKYTVPENTGKAPIKVERLLISNLRKNDTGTYSCLALDSKNDTILASADLLVSVPYFPATIDCSPDGPIAVKEGSTLRMSCTTEIGEPPLNFNASGRSGDGDQWTHALTATTQTLSLERKITVTCKLISQHHQLFRDMTRSCLIGPFTVIPTTSTKSTATEPLTRTPTTSTPTSLNTAEPDPDGPRTPLTSTPTSLNTTTAKVPNECPSQTPCTLSPIPWITISVITLILSTVSLVINIFIVVHLKRSNKEAGPAAIQPEVEPYTGLQPRCNTNKSYTELMIQSKKEEIENAEYEYEYPKLDFENSYDDVLVQKTVQKPYQNVQKFKLTCK